MRIKEKTNNIFECTRQYVYQVYSNAGGTITILVQKSGEFKRIRDRGFALVTVEKEVFENQTKKAHINNAFRECIQHISKYGEYGEMDGKGKIEWE